MVEDIAATVATPVEAVAPGAVALALVDDERVVAAGGEAADRLLPPPGAHCYTGLAEQFEERTGAELHAAARESVETSGVYRTETGAHVQHVGLPWSGDADRVELFVAVDALVEGYERLERFETLVGRAQDGLAAADADGTIRYCNPSFAAALGEDPAALRGRDLTTLVPRDERERYRRAVAAVASGREARLALEVTHETADWGRVPLSVTLGPVDPDEPDAGLVVVARDVTDRRTRERRLERYRTLVEHAADPMWVLDADGRIALANAAMERFLDVGDLEGRAAADLLPEGAADRLTRTATEADDVRRIDVALADADGTDRRFEARVGPMPDAGGAVATFRDVTERQRRREELDHLQQVYGDVVTEELRTTVRAIADRAETLAEEGDGQAAGLATTVAERARTLATIAEKCGQVRDIVEADRTPEECQLAPVVSRSVRRVRENHPDATVNVDLPADLPVRAVESLELAVRNLLDNACRHAGQAPTVTVTGTVADAGVRLTVADDGPGIGDEELEVLERGAETVLEHGSGVGLWLVDWVVDKSGGDLEFETSPSGTEAHVWLDRAAEAAPTDTVEEPAPAPAEVPDDALLVLHVDPNERARRRLSVAAADVDVAVHSVTDVETALTAIELGPADCVVTERLEAGWDRLRAVVETADLPHVLYTDTTDLPEETLTAVDSLVEKGGPASAAFLIEKVRALVDEAAIRSDAGQTPTTRLAQDLGAVAVSAGDTTVTQAGAAVPPDAGRDGTHEVDGRRVRRETLSVDGRSVTVRIDCTDALERCNRAALYGTLVERAGDGLSVVDADGRITYHNRSFADLLGYDDMVGQHSSAFMAEGQLEQGQLAVQRLLASPELDSEVLDMDFVRADGEPITLAVHFAIRRERGEYAGIVNVARDVTDRKARERRLDRYRQLVESAPDPMFAVDGDGEVVLVNAALADFTAEQRDELLGRQVDEMLTGDGSSAVRTATATVREDGGTADCDVWVRDAAGTRRAFAVTASATDGPGAVCTLREVTERRRRADELALLKSVLGRVLRHNLRNELTVVTGHAGALAETVDDERAVLAREIVRLSADLNETAERARAVEGAIDARGERYGHELGDLLAAADAVADVEPSATAPTDTRVLGHPDLPDAVEAIARTLARWQRTDRDLRLDARQADDHCELVFHGDGEPTVDLQTAFRDVGAAITRVDDVGAWLAGWVVDVSGGDLAVERGAGDTRVALRLPDAPDRRKDEATGGGSG